ncbi:MAG: helix-turn-helix transcriptional regulator [Bacteroidia bacterium]
MKKTIPIIKPVAMDEFHFGRISDQLDFSKFHHLFHINKIEDFREKLTFPLPPHRKTLYDLIFLTKGSSIRSKGLNSYTIHQNQFFFLPALQITSHEQMSEDAEGFFLHFSEELFVDVFHYLKPFSFLNFLAHPVVSIPNDKLGPILSILHRLEELYRRIEKKDLSLVVWYLLALFNEVNNFADEGGKGAVKNSATHLTVQYKNALTQHIYQKQTVQEYAEMLFVSPNHLNKCVKATTQKTAQKILNEMLILEAKSLLKYSGYSVSEIAETLFGRTPSNFARFFKNQTGLTPRQYLEERP